MPIDPDNIEAVLFDLDGTFADTAGDLAFALNRTLKHHQRQPLPLETIRPAVSHGGRALIALGFDIEPETPGFEDKRRFLLDVYQKNLCRETRLFEGLEELLFRLEQRGTPWGIVTNKPTWLTDPLMAALGMTERAASIVSGDTCPNAKPHPEPILHACGELGVRPVDCIYVGDAQRDITAGQAAGTATVAALYGYIQPDEDPRSWRADAFVNSPRELAELIGLAN